MPGDPELPPTLASRPPNLVPAQTCEPTRAATPCPYDRIVLLA